jgi:hypothetical protein
VTSVSAILFFCEGAHEAAFVRRILRKFFDAQQSPLKFRELPSPFDKLLQQSVSTKSADAGDLTLNMAKKFSLPDYILRTDGNYFFIFNSGGNKNHTPIEEFFKSLVPLLNAAETFQQDAPSVVEKCKSVFIYDSDDQTVGSIFSWLQGALQNIDDWGLTDKNTLLKGHTPAYEYENGLYVWSGESGHGTLEDVLYPLYKDEYPAQLPKIEAIMDECFGWDTEAESQKTQIANKAKRYKALITSVAQHKRPGKSLSVVYNDIVVGYDNSPEVLNFVDFLKNFIR